MSYQKYIYIRGISKECFISIHTVKAHVAAIHKKLGVNNTVQAVAKIFKDDDLKSVIFPSNML